MNFVSHVCAHVAIVIDSTNTAVFNIKRNLLVNQLTMTDYWGYAYALVSGPTIGLRSISIRHSLQTYLLLCRQSLWAESLDMRGEHGKSVKS